MREGVSSTFSPPTPKQKQLSKIIDAKVATALALNNNKLTEAGPNFNQLGAKVSVWTEIYLSTFPLYHTRTQSVLRNRV